MSQPRFWHRVRFKLLLVSLTLLGIPWAGYRFIQETEQFLREAQDQALRTTASSVANIMHGHDTLFYGVARPGSVLTFRNLFLHQVDKAPTLDGYRDEWPRFERNFAVLQSTDDTLQAKVFIARHGRYLYLLLGVKDPTPAFGPDADTVELAVKHQGSLRRYRIQPEAPGWVAARTVVDPDAQTEASPTDQTGIRGEWQPHPAGYTLELRLPRDLVDDRLSLRITDSASHQMLASGRMFPADALGRLVEYSATLEEVLDAMTPPATRVWVTDHQGLVLARAGRLDSDPPLSADQPRMPWFIRELILAVLPRDADAVAALDDDRTHLFMAPVIDALRGRPANLRRLPPRGDAVVVSAAVPIRSGDGIHGAVLVEQTTNAILSIQNLALQRLFGVTLVFFAVTSLGLLAFASLLASRITRLRDRVEAAVSPDGRIIGRLAPDPARDEIGDLGRSFASVLERLHEYNHYLEATASRLAHELRTPLAVVRTSLENADQAPDQTPFLARARDGAERLEQILTRLREATGLEQAMRQAEPVAFDLATSLRLQLDGFRDAHPSVAIQLDGAEQPIPVVAVPDLIGQAIDKLLGNAVDFHSPGSTITIACDRRADRLRIAVSNLGPPLPADLDIFQSMISGREGHQNEPHLGLGLYLVRLIAEFHGGGVQAESHDAPSGATVSFYLPLQAN